MYTNFINSFPAKLRALRTQAGKSQEALAKELGISRSCLANYETGNRQPDQEMLLRIADTFNVLTDYLIGRDEFCNFNLTCQEISDFSNLKNVLEEQGVSLDLSPLNSEGRIFIIQFYNFIMRKIKAEEALL